MRRALVVATGLLPVVPPAFASTRAPLPGGGSIVVGRSGLFSTYDAPAHLVAVQHRGGLNIAVWLYDKDGGVRRARAMADQIAASLQR